jgi:lipoyl(octanoyl) transferase
MQKIQRFNYHKYEVWRSHQCVEYKHALKIMEAHVQKIRLGSAKPTLWLLEHPDTYTAGALTQKSDYPKSISQKIIPIDRGGKLTYHGPGQLIVYVMIPLTENNKDVRKFIESLEQYIIEILKKHTITNAFASRERVGIWLGNEKDQSNQAKIAAIGIKIRQWITSHGIAINISSDLKKFDPIVPCGLANAKTVSMQKINPQILKKDVIRTAHVLAHSFLSHYF